MRQTFTTILFLFNLTIFGQVPRFIIPLSASTDSKSVYYFKTVEEKLIKLDTSVTAEQIISLTKFNISRNQTDPTLLDSLAKKLYKLNEEQKYDDAINVGKLILIQSPTNITGHKEISFAYRKIRKDSISNRHFQMMIKVVTSVMKYGDGTYDFPFLINNLFEGVSIYEGAYRCYPKKMALMLDKRDRLLGAYNGYSSALDQILIKYSELTHWKPKLKETDYIKEEK